MSEVEERQKKGAALLEYTESKQALELLLKDARDMAEKYEAVAKILRKEPTRIDNTNPTFPTGKDAFDLSERIRDAYTRHAELETTVRNLGLI